MNERPDSGALCRDDMHPDPFEQLRRWLDDARGTALSQPDAMALATATPEGAPSVRMVLLRGLDRRGLVFYTDARSQKGIELAANPRAAVVLYWDALARQVRASGPVEPVPASESDAYFARRARGSRISAWTSTQSAVVPGRADLERRHAETAARFGAGDIPRPAYWGGYRLRPERFEFWQSRADRLHDRFRYTRPPGAGWHVERLSP